MPISEELLSSIAKGELKEKCLALCYAELNDDDIIQLVAALKQNKKVTALVLKGNAIGDKSVQALVTLKHLTFLDLTDNSVTPVGAKYLAESALTSLNLSANRTLGDSGALAIAESNTLKWLSMGCCEIEDEGAFAILSNPVLENVDMSVNNISDAGLESISSNKSLLIADLSQNNIGSNGAKAIALNTHLKKILLGSNLVGDEGAKFLARNRSISELDLSLNKIGEEGFLALCQNPIIQRLILSNNKIYFSEDKPLPQALALIALNLDFNKIKDIPEGPLRSFTTAFPRLEKLSIIDNEIGAKGAVIFSQFKKSLRELDLSGPKIPIELRSFSF